MAFPIGSFMATLGMDTSSYVSSILSAQSVTAVFGQTFTTFLTNPILGGIQAVASLGKSIAGATGRLLDQAEALDINSKATGISIELLQTLIAAYEDAGGSAEGLMQSLLFTTKAMADAKHSGSDLAKQLAEIGFRWDALQSADENFLRLLDALRATGDRELAADLGAKIFGRGGGPEFIRRLEGGSAALRQLQRDLIAIGAVRLQETNDGILKLDTALDNLQRIGTGLAGGLLGDFLAGLGASLEENLNEQQIRDLAAAIRQDLTDAFRTAGDRLGEFAEAVELLVSGLKELRDIRRELVQFTVSIMEGALNIEKTLGVSDMGMTRKQLRTPFASEYMERMRERASQ